MAISEKQLESIYSDLEQGHSLKEACRTADASATRFLDLIANDSAHADHYARVRQMGYTLRADELEAVAADLDIPADHKRIMVDTRKWMLSKMLPKIYGDRLNLEHSGKVQTEQALTDAELAAIAAKGK